MLCPHILSRLRSKGLPHGLWDTSKLLFLYRVLQLLRLIFLMLFYQYCISFAFMIPKKNYNQYVGSLAGTSQQLSSQLLQAQMPGVAL